MTGSDVRYFVVVGNTRVGSTWLSVATHALPGVFNTREIRWRMPYMDAAPPVHFYVDSTTTSIKERLEAGRGTASVGDVRAVGAKLKFDPYGYVPPPAFDELAGILEPDIHVVFLRRSYFEIFQTWKAFGIRHLANPRAKLPGTETNLEEAARLSRFHAMHSVPLDGKRVFITSGGRVIARAVHNRYGGGDSIHYAVSDAIDDLLVLFYNDVMALKFVDGRPDADVFTYPEIREKFSGVVRKLGIEATRAECEAVLDNASTSRIEPDNLDAVHPSGALKEISDYLDEVFKSVHGGACARDDVVQVDLERQAVTFRLPKLPAIFARHTETQNLLRAGRPPMGAIRRFIDRVRLPLSMRKLLAANAQAHDGVWHARRPIHTPVAVAPPPTKPPAVANSGSPV